MSAVIDRSGTPYFLIETNQHLPGASPTSQACLFEMDNDRPGLTEKFYETHPVVRPEAEKTWLVCRHLSPSHNFIDNYLTFRYFIIYDSHIFCHHCHREATYESASSSQKMELHAVALTDRQLQQQLFSPLYRVNYDLGEKPAGATRDQIATWYVCKHLSGWANLRQYVFSRNTIYFLENNVICAHCLDTFVQGLKDEFDQNLILMRDRDLQKIIVNNLFLVNYEFSLIHGFVDDSAPF
jgi:hypothetical protein